MIALDELCDLAAGRTPLFIELKSHFDGDRRLVERTAATLSRYRGGAAVMSFDPMQMALLRDIAPSRARGLVAETEPARKPGFDLGRLRGKTAYAVQVLRMRPQFLAYCVDDLPSTSTSLARNLLGIPILAWTVRDAASRRKADRYADQIIFEGFKP
jgi:glycerophosphoryl diester phosphodiesterase